MSITAQSYMAKANVSAAYDPNDPLTSVYQNLIALYRDPKSADSAAYIESCLRSRQILYWKNNPGDCPKTTQVGPGAIATGARYGTAAIGTIASIGGAINSFAAAGTGLATAGEASLAIAGPAALAILPFAIWGAISAHHAVAVQKEQTDLCQVAAYVNQNFQAIAAANIDWKTAKDNFNQVATQALGAADSVKKSCNAACVIETGIKALRDLMIQLYGTPSSSTSLAAQLSPNNPGSVAGTPGAAPGSSPTQANGGTAALIGAGVIGAHFMGVF